MFRRLTLAALALAALGALAVPATAQHRRDVAAGTLECRSPGTIALIISVRDYECVFFANDGRAYHYQGRVHRIGLEAGITGHEVLVWTVFAPTSRLDARALRGNYAGAHAGIGVVVGLGGNVLVGGSNQTISLQPVSVEATVGINIALSVAGLSLH